MKQIGDAIAAGRKIQAIKLYRAATGHDLTDSKDFIEKLTSDLQASDPARFPVRKSAGCLSLLLAMGTIAGLLAFTR
jgi:hypothetical protein